MIITTRLDKWTENSISKTIFFQSASLNKQRKITKKYENEVTLEKPRFNLCKFYWFPTREKLKQHSANFKFSMLKSLVKIRVHFVDYNGTFYILICLFPFKTQQLPRLIHKCKVKSPCDLICVPSAVFHSIICRLFGPSNHVGVIATCFQFRIM